MGSHHTSVAAGPGAVTPAHERTATAPATAPGRPFGTAAAILDLQSRIGNHAATQLVTLLGPRLGAGLDGRSPVDRYEREARGAAAHLLRGGTMTPSRRPARVPEAGAAPPGAPGDGAPGAFLDAGIRSVFERRLGADLSGVRVHTGGEAERAATMLSARAFTVGQHIVFGSEGYEPGTARGWRLLAHELTHTVQQGTEPTAIQCDDLVEVELITILDKYTPPGGGSTYRVGDTAASSVLMKIEEDGAGRVRFFWFNFSRGEPQVGSWRDWDFRVGAATIGLNARDFAGIGRALTAAQWAALWPDPRPELLKLYEQGKLAMPADAVVETYTGLIHNQALRTLDENEKAVDALLATPDRLAFFQRYSEGLREASLVRDALEARRAQLAAGQVQMQGFSFGMAGRVVGMDPARRLQVVREATAVDQTLAFWLSAFPLLSRLRTSDVRPVTVVATLHLIKQNIVTTRAQLALGVRGRGPLELWDLDNVRSQVNSTLGPRARAAIEAEDASRRRWGWVKAGAGLALGIALLFVPGGAFIDVAIGAAMGVEAVDRARVLGRAANTGMDVDAGLVSRAAAAGAEFEAVLATVFAVLGAAGIGLRVLRVSRMLLRVREVAPALELAAQVRVARLLAGNQAWLRAGADLAELNRAVLRAASGLRFEEVRALRALVYQAQGVPLPAHSAEGLTELLQVVWGRRQQILRGGPGEVYKIYSSAAEANPLTKQPAQYLQEVAGIARGRPAGAISNVQSSGAEILDLVGAGRFSGSQIERTFYRFERAGARLEEVGERVYLNVGADRAPEVMRTVVKDIVDNPTKFPGTRMAKLAGPGSVSGRAESIVVYVTDAAEARRVVDRLRTFQAANPSAFKSGTPYLSEKVLEGVSLGSEPLAARGGASFGQVRSQAIYDALRTTMGRGEGAERFAEAAAEQLRRMGVNPSAPHLNLPAGPTP